MTKLILALSLLALSAAPNELRLALRHDPKTFDPVFVSENAGETIRYLTGGVLIRINRRTQQPEPALATSWNTAAGGRQITFQLRRGLRFSDGTPFSAEDVVYTLDRIADPERKSPLRDAFGETKPRAKALAGDRVSVTLAAPLAGFERVFDQIAICSRQSAAKERAVLGPFAVEEYQPGRSVVLARNPRYWKKDAHGRRLPYLDRIRFDIQPNREIENVRFSRGELHMISELDPETFDRLHSGGAGTAIDAGPTNESEFLWFNQVRTAPIPEHKRAWFRSGVFRKAVSHAISRADIVRLVFRGHAEAAAGPYPASNKAWFNTKLKPDAFSPRQSLAMLAREGFEYRSGVLYDRNRHPVEFSVVTNSGNKARARMAAMIQQDLARIGIRVTVAPLEFGSLVDRIVKSFAYEACLLGLVNVDPDPNGMMNVWLSSGANHQWNPGRPAPETPWEAEIDKLMRAQSSTVDRKKRKAAFDRVQEIVAAEAPFIYLVTKYALVAVHGSVRNASASAFRPHLLWNAEYLAR